MATLAAVDAQVVVDLADTRDVLNEVLGTPLFAAFRHTAGERHFPVLDLHLDLLVGVDVRLAARPIRTMSSAHPAHRTAGSPSGLGCRGKAAVAALRSNAGLAEAPR